MSEPLQPVHSSDGTSKAFKIFAILEAISWACLLVAMYFKHVANASFGDDAVRYAGMTHGMMFIVYCILALKLWQSREWPIKEFILSIVSAIVPLMTIWFERKAMRQNLI